jgi:hypothetical protein
MTPVAIPIALDPMSLLNRVLIVREFTAETTDRIQ